MAHAHPIADNIFDAVCWDSGQESSNTGPDGEGLGKIRIGAVTIVEGIELLKVPRLLAPAGDVNNSTGRSTELSPADQGQDRPGPGVVDC
jgi:hypothetical protein